MMIKKVAAIFVFCLAVVTTAWSQLPPPPTPTVPPPTPTQVPIDGGIALLAAAGAAYGAKKLYQNRKK